MPEQYEVAAWRHLATADRLLATKDFDDAGYHFGVSGENCLKSALTSAGLKTHLAALGKWDDPMRAHLPKIQNLMVGAQAIIAANATGRLAAPIIALTSSVGFTGLFSGWSIDIRYADTGVCPVSEPVTRQWKADAELLAWDLMV